MSYDVWLQDGDEEVTGSHNYTYNIAPMLRVAWDGAGIRDLHGKNGADAAELLRGPIMALSTDTERFDALNPQNGWGNREGCVDWLKRIQADCLAFPEGTVHVG